MFAQYENAISALKSVNIPPSYMYLYPTPTEAFALHRPTE